MLINLGLEEGLTLGAKISAKQEGPRPEIGSASDERLEGAGTGIARDTRKRE